MTDYAAREPGPLPTGWDYLHFHDERSGLDHIAHNKNDNQWIAADPDHVYDLQSDPDIASDYTIPAWAYDT